MHHLQEYAGINAKSMWRRRVFKKQEIAMSNRRENIERSKRVIACVVLYIKVTNVLDAKGSQEKENLSVFKRSRSIDDTQATKFSQVVVSSTCCPSGYIRLVR